MVSFRDIPQDEIDAIRESWYVKDGILRWKRAARGGKSYGDPVGYSARKSGHRNVFMWHGGKLRGYVYSRIVWLLHYGSMPEGEIDHINCDPTDNRVENLRTASRDQNMWNAGLSRAGKPKKGYYQDRRTGKYHVQVQCQGVVHSLNGFDTEVEAAAARQKLAQRLHGEYAR